MNGNQPEFQKMQIKTAMGCEKQVGRFFLKSGTQDIGGSSQRWLPEASVAHKHRFFPPLSLGRRTLAFELPSYSKLNLCSFLNEFGVIL